MHSWESTVKKMKQGIKIRDFKIRKQKIPNHKRKKETKNKKGG